MKPKYIVVMVIADIAIMVFLIWLNIDARQQLSSEKSTYQAERKFFEKKVDSLNTQYSVLTTSYEKSIIDVANKQKSYDSLKNEFKKIPVIYVTKNIPLLSAPISVLDSFWTARQSIGN